MCLFIETIHIEAGQSLRLDLHNERMNRTRQSCLGKRDELHLEEYLETAPHQVRTKCHVAYADQILEITYDPYRIRPVHSLQLVQDDQADYTYKYSDRSCLNRAFAQRGTADDVLIVRKGVLTDTTICNIALWDGVSWWTPDQPLLSGTHRAALLATVAIRERRIHDTDLSHYSRIRLFNAMIDFGEVELPVNAIRMLP